ncbi:MAG TPA: ECF-type sigma factor [Pirellulales bacterium]|nr:ECF-type sigma factor [Pirellulales bacterium]
MSSDNSVTHWIASLKAGQAEAVQKLWARYKNQLVLLARRKLGRVPKRIADEDDVAQSVFFSLCRGAAAGRFEDVKNRDDLWWLLLAITKQKSVDLVRRETAQKRGAGRVRSESAAGSNHSGRFSLDQLISEQATPELLVMLEEQSRWLLGSLRDDQLRKIASSRIEGYSVGEIAIEMAVTTRTVERKLKLIRDAWTKEFKRAERCSKSAG